MVSAEFAGDSPRRDIIAKHMMRKLNPFSLFGHLVVALILVSFAVNFGKAKSIRSTHSRSIDFNRDVRPILAENCFACHGPDKNKRKAGLRLDLRDDATAKLESGERAVVPGNVEKSHLLKLVSATDDDDRMPPAKTGKRLTKEQIDLLRDWIAQGAEFKQHWAYLPPERPALPSVKNKRWPRNEIDHFILARLEKEGLKPSAEAEKHTLIRRATLDLTGLPPTIAEVDAFLADKTPAAYEKVVDRLLASQSFGEKLALQWLDLARYADSDGYHADTARSMWQQAVRPVHHRTARRRFAAEPHARSAHRHRLQSERHEQHRGWRGSGRVHEQVCDGPREHVRHRLSWIEHGLHGVSRPQVRSVYPA
jgi:hypothetical protein